MFKHDFFFVGRTRESKSDTAEVIVQSDINVMPDERAMGRATVATPTLGEALQMVTKQLLQDPTATDMVATDVRTPPRVKNRLEGEAIPIADVPDVSTPRTVAKVTTNGGLSTWILLSNAEQSTTTPYKKKTTTPPQSQAKKAHNTPRPTAIIEKVIKKGNETKIEKLSSSIASPLVATKKPDRSTTKQPLYDSKFKNRTPIVVGRVPSQKNKTDSTQKKVPTTQIPVTTNDVVTKKKTSGSKHTVYIPEAIPTTSLLLESSTLEAPEEHPTTAAVSTTTTKRTRRPSTKTKKKKNKVRTRPTKQPSSQNKIDTEVAETKIENFNRPLSTRIYNYLAREVMPNVGVGLVGLVLTAGLAGLLLYPFGGVVTRRNYDKVAPTPDSHTYYYDSYSPHAGEISNVNIEDNKYAMTSNQPNSYVAPVYEGQKYNNHYRYEVQDYANENVNGYAGIKDYSTLPDSVKNSQYSTLPENANYYNMEPMVPINPQYKDMEEPMNKYDGKYPSLTEYTAYTSASAVGTSGTYDKSSGSYDKSDMNYEKPIMSYESSQSDYERSDMAYEKSPTYHGISNKNKTSKSETDSERVEKDSDKRPQYSALSSQPSYANSDFVGSVSVSGSYGAELGHMTGMLPSTDLGPRNLKLKRKKRDSSDNLNEIDSNIMNESSTVKDDLTTVSQETTTLNNYENSNDHKVKNPYEVDDKEFSNEILPVDTNDSIPTTTDGNHISDLQNNETDQTTNGTISVPDEEFGFLNLLRRLLQLKLKVGINFIRTTSEAFQRYVARVTQRMETAMMKLNERSYASSSLNEIHRRKRETNNKPFSKLKYN